MTQIKDIKLDPIELRSEVALCIAYCIGASYDDAIKIASAITEKEIDDCIFLIRNRMNNSK